jgi:hypothetical protein
MMGKPRQNCGVSGSAIHRLAYLGWMWCFWILWRSLAGQACAQPRSDWHLRLQTEAPAAWQKYHEHIKTLQVSVLRTSRRNDGTPEEDQLVEQFRHRDGMLLALREHRNLRGKVPIREMDLWVLNPRYAFLLSRGREDKPWALEGVVKAEKGEELGFDPKRVSAWFTRAYIPFWLVSDHNPITHPSFKIRELTEVSKPNGLNVLRVDFEHTLNRHGESWFTQGWITLQPQRYWLIEEGQLTQPATGVRCRLEYKELPDGFPALHRFVTCREQSGQWRTIMELTYEYWDKPPAWEEFWLRHYGFPEPEELRWQRPTPWWLYILLAGLALVMLSFAIYAWRRHRRQQLALP